MQWKDKPRDLDLHLFSFDSKTLDLVTHCYFGNRGADTVGVGLEHGERLHLDHDHTQVCRKQSFCPWCVRVANFDFPRYCLQLLLDQVLTHLQGNGKETMTLGDYKGLLVINHQHTYVWMVHQYSEDPDDGRMQDQFMSVSFEGMFNHMFDTPIPGPENSRWRLFVVAKLEGGELKVVKWNKLLPPEDTGTSCHLNVAAILPFLKPS
jgi:hypothetical protein